MCREDLKGKWRDFHDDEVVGKHPFSKVEKVLSDYVSHFFITVFFPAVRLLPVPDVTGDTVRIYLHDTCHHRRKISGSLQANHLQVRRGNMAFLF